MASSETPLAGPDLAAGVRADEVPEGAVLLGHAGGEAVLLTRVHGKLAAIGATCTHYGGPLAEGAVVDGTIRCPWHHAAFDLRTGEAVRPPALNPVGCWRVEERDGIAIVAGRMERTGAPARSGQAAGTSPGAGSDGGPESVVIIGGGAAGAVAAETLRREGYGRRITVLEGGPAAPYDRPNLSKDYLAGNAPEEWIPLRPETFYSDLGIDMVLDARVAEIDVAGRRVLLEDGATHRFGALLLATGAEPIRLDLPEAAQPVRYLRTLADCRAIIGAAEGARSAVVIGASFIGLEVAASLRTRGLGVTVVAPEARPLEKVMGPAVGNFIRTLHEERGVEFRLGETVASVGADSVTLSGGATVRADLVVAGVGARPVVWLAERAGLATERGVLVDEFLETSAPGIYAAGDIARWPDSRSRERIRVEHWVVAQRQGQAAARNLLASDRSSRERFDAVPFFWSAHYDTVINYVGHAQNWDEANLSGDLAARDATVEFRSGGRTLAVATVGRDRENLDAEVALERMTAVAQR